MGSVPIARVHPVMQAQVHISTAGRSRPHQVGVASRLWDCEIAMMASEEEDLISLLALSTEFVCLTRAEGIVSGGSSQSAILTYRHNDIPSM
jgi:hypothetical protein